MKQLVWCIVVVGMVSGAAVIQDLYDDSAEDVNYSNLRSRLPVEVSSEEVDDDQAQGIKLASIPLAYHVPGSVGVQPLAYHVPGAMYNLPGSSRSTLSRTPASTVLLPWLSQTSAGTAPVATTRGNAADICIWLARQCLTIIPGIDKPPKPTNPRRIGRSAAGFTPAYFRYGYSPTVASVQYPVHVVPQVGMPATYGPSFWCGLLAFKCLPDLDKIPEIQNLIQNQIG